PDGPPPGGGPGAGAEGGDHAGDRADRRVDLLGRGDHRVPLRGAAVQPVVVTPPARAGLGRRHHRRCRAGASTTGALRPVADVPRPRTAPRAPRRHPDRDTPGPPGPRGRLSRRARLAARTTSGAIRRPILTGEEAGRWEDALQGVIASHLCASRYRERCLTLSVATVR